MWPFKQKAQRLIMPRYTEQVWAKLNMGSRDEWADSASPNNVTEFIKKSVVNELRKHKKRKYDSALIATIDDDYITWLGPQKHSIRKVKQYIESKTTIGFWDNKLINSNMTNSYNVLNIPISIIPCKTEGNKTCFQLTKEHTKQVELILQNIYKTRRLYCPGWILKGYDAPTCVGDLIEIAEALWYENQSVTMGKYEEQTYTNLEMRNRFAPHLFTAPFVVRVNLKSALINLNGQYQESDKSSHAMTFIKFGNNAKLQILENIKECVDLVVGIGDTAIMPGQAYLSYVDNLEMLESKRKMF